MPTILSFLSGRQITNDSGVPQTGAKIYHYRATTTTALIVWQDSGETVPHPQPVVCDGGGFVPLIYVDDTFNWKTVVTTSADVILPQYNFDNLSKAEADASALGFAPVLLEWTQVTSAGSPVALVPGDAGKGYEGDTTGGNITFNLPSAASVGNGKGFAYKKTAGSNSIILASFGAELIEGSTSDYTIGFFNQTVYIISNGANWLAFAIVGDPILAARLPSVPTVQRFTSGSGTYTPAALVRRIRVCMVGGGGGGGASATNGGAVGGDTSFASWTAIHGNGGAVGGTSTGGAGGTAGVNGTGTLLARFDGADGGDGSNTSTTAFGGPGGSSVFGGGGALSLQNATANAAKANTGSGGSGGGQNGGNGGGGGGAGEYVEFNVTAPVAVSYAVGAGGAGGAAGTQAGAAGAAGIIIVEEFYL
jgi:hypothetical protein